jgi:hypothetical protein
MAKMKLEEAKAHLLAAAEQYVEQPTATAWREICRARATIAAIAGEA